MTHWAFVLNQVSISVDLPFELAPDCFISRASDEQRERIKKVLSRNFPHEIGSSGDFYEGDTALIPDGARTEIRTTELPEAEWRYYVVTTPGNGHDNYLLHMASNISKAVLEISALTFKPPGGYTYRSAILQNFFEGLPLPAREIGLSELEDLADAYKDIRAFSKEGYPEIWRAMGMLDSLSFLAERSPFHVLGLFAIIEMLITHNPKLEDRGDSITHQMQSKIPLLSRRFYSPLQYDGYFPSVPEKKVWQALYKYRSAIAHGGVVDFSSGDLKVLGSDNKADEFLREVVRALIRHALKEPQLYRDLRNC